MRELLLSSGRSLQAHPVGIPKPGWLEDKAKKLGYSSQEIYLMGYNQLLEVLGLVIEGTFKEVPPRELPSGKDVGV